MWAQHFSPHPVPTHCTQNDCINKSHSQAPWAHAALRYRATLIKATGAPYVQKKMLYVQGEIHISVTHFTPVILLLIDLKFTWRELCRIGIHMIQHSSLELCINHYNTFKVTTIQCVKQKTVIPIYQWIKVPAQCATASTGRALKIWPTYVVLIKVNQKSQTPCMGTNRVCGFVFWVGDVGEGDPTSLSLKENILLHSQATKEKNLICLEN